MATSADIARQNPDGSLTITHISGDGYLSGVGAVLFRKFSTVEAQQKLWASDGSNVCAEDWGEDEFYLMDEDSGEREWVATPIDEIDYLWRDNQWFYRDWETTGAPLVLITRAAILADADDYFGQDGVNRLTKFLDGKGPFSG